MRHLQIWMVSGDLSLPLSLAKNLTVPVPQIDLVFHSVYGHNPHSYVMSNRSRLVAQELST